MRSGYSDDCEGTELNLWRGAVRSAIRGARGQKFLRELVAALDALPEKILIQHEFAAGGAVCALGAVARARRMNVSELSTDPQDRDEVAGVFGIAPALAAEIMFENDGDYDYEQIAPEERFRRVRVWAENQIREGA